jgi:chromosome segregation ATPase
MGIMPSYEELYYIARNKYEQAIEDKNAIQQKTNQLEGEKSSLTRELAEKKTALADVQKKITLIQDALDKGKCTLDDEFASMKSDIQTTSEEYKKIITASIGVADLQSIYASDIQSTLNNLNSIISELSNQLQTLQEQENTAQKAVNDCDTNLQNVTSQLNNVGDVSAAQRSINNYYAEMKEYEVRWQNEE